MFRLSIVDCIAEGWEYFKQQPGLAIGGGLLYGAMAGLGGMIPLFGFFFSLLVAPALMGGFYFLYLNLARGDESKLDDLFVGFSRFGSTLGLYWVISGIMFVGMLPSLLYTIITMDSFLTSEYAAADAIALMVANMTILAILMFRFVFAWFVLMDDPSIGVFDAMKKSSKLTYGHRFSVFLLLFVTGVISLATIILLFLPMLVVGPVMMIAFARAYIKLKGHRDRPWHVTSTDPSPTPTEVPQM